MHLLMYSFSPNVKKIIHKRNEEWMEARRKNYPTAKGQSMTRQDIVETSNSEQFLENLEKQ